MRKFWLSTGMNKVHFFLSIAGYINAFIWFLVFKAFLYREFVEFEILIPAAILFLNYLLAITLLFLSFMMWEGKKGRAYYFSIASSVLVLLTILIFIWP